METKENSGPTLVASQLGSLDQGSLSELDVFIRVKEGMMGALQGVGYARRVHTAAVYSKNVIGERAY